MTMVNEIAEALDTRFDWLILPENAGTGVTGNLFEDLMPDSPDDAVAVYEYGGQGPTQTQGNTNPTERPRLQIMVRHHEVETARLWAKKIMIFLIAKNDEVISGVRYIKISAASNVSVIGTDSENRYRCSTNYDVEKEWSPDDIS